MLGLQWSLYKEKGFIYIDVLIALVVLSVAIIAILYTYNTSLNVNKENDDLKTAVVLANNQLNFLKKYDGSLKDRDNTVWSKVDDVIYTEPKSKEVYSVTSRVLKDAEIPDDIKNNINIIPIEVKVVWSKSSGQSGDNEYKVIGYYIGAPDYAL